MLNIIQLIGKYWYVVAIIAWGAVAFGYGYKVRGDRCDDMMRVANEMFQSKAQEQSVEFEKEITNLKKNRISNQVRTYETSKPEYSCVIPTIGVQQYISALKANPR